MSITSVSMRGTAAAVPTVSTGNSTYTAIVDQHAKTLAAGSNASIDDQIAAWHGLSKLMLLTTEPEQVSVLLAANKEDHEKASSALFNSEIMKKMCSAQERMYRAQQSFGTEIQDKQGKGEIARVEEYQLRALNMLSVEDQKLVFAANGNGAYMGMSEGKGCRSINMEFASLDAFKTFLKNRINAFARDQANRPQAAAPVKSTVAGSAHQESRATSMLSTKSSSKNSDAAVLPAKSALPSAPPTSGMITAAVALQLLQSAAKADGTSNGTGQLPPAEKNAGAGNTGLPLHNPQPSIKLHV